MSTKSQDGHANQAKPKLVLKLAEENIWGYRRIAGKMKKLGHELCSGTVRNMLIKNGLPPAPQRKDISWKRFIQSHMDVSWGSGIFGMHSNPLNSTTIMNAHTSVSAIKYLLALNILKYQQKPLR